MPIQQVFQKVVDGAADIGKIYSVISLLIMAIIFIIVLHFFAIKMIARASKYSVQTPAQITKVTPYSDLMSSSISKCDLTITYLGKTKTFNDIMYCPSYVEGKTISVYYDKNNSSDVILAINRSNKSLGIILIIIFGVFFIGAIVHTIIIFTNRSFAAASGAIDFYNRL